MSKIESVDQDILGQYYFAFGQGARSLRVSRSTIATLREVFGPYINAKHWNHNAPHVLELFRACGRLAAQYAVTAGRVTVLPEDLLIAYRLVRRSAHEQPQGHIVGSMCPVPADTESTDEATKETPVPQPANEPHVSMH